MASQDYAHSATKEVRAEIAILLKLGFVYTGPTGAGWLCFEHRDEPFLTQAHPREITLAPSPNSKGWRQKHRHRLARLLGLNQWQLERLIAGQPLEKVKREPSPGRPSNETVVMEHAMSLGIGCNRAQASQLLSRFGDTKAARKALTRMAAVAARQGDDAERRVAA